MAIAAPPVVSSSLSAEAPPAASAFDRPAEPAAKTRRGEAVLDVNNLRTYFFTYDGVVKALDGVTFRIRRGETLGLVGETGCGKSVTAFSITRLIADPPGRIMDGTIHFKGANLLFGVHEEAAFKPVKKTNRVKVIRHGRRIRAAIERMTAVRGGGISMIFQEPMTALNPIFRIGDQISEALELHQGGVIIERLLSARPDDPAVAKAVERAIEVAGGASSEALRAATDEIGRAARLPSLGTEAFYLLRGAPADPRHRRLALHKLLRRARLTGLQRNYLRAERARLELRDSIKQVYLEEMRTGHLYRARRNALRARMLRRRLQRGYFGLPGLKGRVRYPLTEETFWESVQHLEGVSIANPDRVARGYPHELSGGMIQRVMIAMALSAQPELLIADEPTTALDVTIQAQILDLMRQLKERTGSAILLITHDLGVIAEVADRVCVMYAGNVVEVGPVRDIFARPLHPYTQGLLNSIPRLDDPGRQLESIPGTVPNLITPPSGCRFRTRCAHAMPICAETRPPMTVEGEGHQVACYLYHGRAPEQEDR